MRMNRGQGWLNNRRKSIVLINAAMMTCNYDGNGDNKVKDDDADLKSPELVRVIPVLALHVARPDQHLDHHLVEEDLDEDLRSPAIVVNTLPPASAVST